MPLLKSASVLPTADDPRAPAEPRDGATRPREMRDRVSSVGCEHILAVLEPVRSSMVLDTAAALAEFYRARLTLVQLSDPGAIFAWFGGEAYVRHGDEPTSTAARQLDRAVASLSPGTPVTGLILGRGHRRELHELLRSRDIDTVVATDTRLRQQRLDGNAARTLGVRPIAVTARP